MNVQRALLAQIIAKLRPARVIVVDAASKPWASVTFAGERHELTLLVEGDAAGTVAQRLERTIRCEEFDITGHLVADILITHKSADMEAVRLDIQALTVHVD